MFDFPPKCVINAEHNSIDRVEWNDRLLDPLVRRRLRIYLNHNPIHCGCDNLFLHRYFDRSINQRIYDDITISGDQIICSNFSEFKNEIMNKISAKSFWCSTDDKNCPKNAKCFTRDDNFYKIKFIEVGSVKSLDINTFISKPKYANFSIIVSLHGNEIDEMPNKNMGYSTVRGLDMSFNLLTRFKWLPEHLTVSIDTKSII